MYCQLNYLRGYIRGVSGVLWTNYQTLSTRHINARCQRSRKQTGTLCSNVCGGSRTIRVEELAEFLEFDFEVGPPPKLHEDWRLADPVDAVLSTCPTHVAVVNVQGSESPVI